MSSVNFNSIGRPHQQTAQTKKIDSVNLQNSSNVRRNSYAKWAVISAIATVGIASAAILIYQYASSLGDRDIQPDGLGVKIFSNGCQYTGNFYNNFMHGTGVYSCPDGNKYDGDWKDGLQHGNGVYTWPSGSKYKGEFQNNKIQGKGVLTSADGSRYDGD